MNSVLIINGANSGDYSGLSVSSGDINRDGTEDVIIDSFGNENNTYIFYGSDFLVTSINKNKNLPLNYILFNNYPNPFNPVTKITFQLPKSAKTRLTIYDSIGRNVITLVDEYLNVGYHSCNFNAENLTSGLYLYSLKIDGKVLHTKKMTLIK